jgi:hypothetical protein
MHMRYIVATLLSLLHLPAAGFTICDVEVGKAITVEQVRRAMFVRCNAGWAGLTVCSGTARLAERTATANVVIDKTGVVQRIRLHPETNHYDIVLAHLHAQYGRPRTSDRTASRDARGFFDTQETNTWATPSGHEMVLVKLSAVPNRSLLYVGTAADRALLGSKLE